jgi:hypothetical protein
MEDVKKMKDEGKEDKTKFNNLVLFLNFLLSLVNPLLLGPQNINIPQIFVSCLSKPLISHVAVLKELHEWFTKTHDRRWHITNDCGKGTLSFKFSPYYCTT